MIGAIGRVAVARNTPAMPWAAGWVDGESTSGR
jgi:hypothetical protein